MTNKDRAATFLEMASAGAARQAFEQFVAPGFIHHNQFFKGDRESLLGAMEDAGKSTPNRTIAIKRLLEDGDFIVAHSLITRQDPAADKIVAVHIFRFKGDRIAELWDVGQLLLKDTPNENGPF